MCGDKKIKIIYLAGWGRSGSTLLDQTIGKLDGFFSCGELIQLWKDPRFLDYSLCSCGSPVKSCPFWSRVFARDIEIERVQDLCRRVVRSRNLFRLLVNPSGLETECAKAIGEFYRAVWKEAAEPVALVDSSKYPPYLAVLSLSDLIDLSIVHLVRDPRAVAYSMQRKKLSPRIYGSKPFRRRTPLNSALTWMYWNTTTELVKSRLRSKSVIVKYEDFASNPVDQTAQIVECDKSHILIDAYKEQHLIAGNTSRFNTGTFGISEDREWIQMMNLRSKLLVVLIAFPLMMKYKYRLI